MQATALVLSSLRHVAPRPDAVQVDEDGGFEWQRGWEVAFQSISDRVIVPPILRKLVLNRYPAQVLSWVETVAAWDFLHVVSAHFSAQVPLTSDEFRKVTAVATDSAFQVTDGSGHVYMFCVTPICKQTLKHGTVGHVWIRYPLAPMIPSSNSPII